MPNNRGHPKVAIVGAGVVGLTTATLFQESLPNANVTLISDKFLTETTSDGAAGIFRPGSSFIGPSPEITKKWMKESYDFYNDIIVSSLEKAHNAGIRRISGYYLSSIYPSAVENPVLQEVLSDYRKCTPSELKMFGHDYKYGTFCTTILTECRRYLPYLTELFKSRGGIIIQKRLEGFEELSEEFDLVFNCSGLGARALCGDKTLTSIRGQVFKVKAPWLTHFVYTDYDVYIIPGMNSVTLGGIRQFGSFKEGIDKHESKVIWDRCVEVVPELKNAEVEREWAGLRPYRPFVRVEKELLKLPNGRTLKVVHNYGHGGYGVMTAPGTSINAVQLGIQYLDEEISLKSRL